MKKLYAIFLSIFLLLSLSLSACNLPDETTSTNCEHNWISFADKNSTICSLCGAFDGISINEQNWDSALSEEVFNNVTISFTFLVENIVDVKGNYVDAEEGVKTVQLFKSTDEKVYRKAYVYNADGTYREDEYFELTLIGTEAQMQRKMFYDMFAALLKNYDNFTYDDEKNIYKSPSEIIVDVSDSVGETQLQVFESINNAQIKFGTNGKLEYFESDHKESIYEDDLLLASISGKILWTYSNYGTTIID